MVTTTSSRPRRPGPRTRRSSKLAAWARSAWLAAGGLPCFPSFHLLLFRALERLVPGSGPIWEAGLDMDDGAIFCNAYNAAWEAWLNVLSA
jgi:hypothetical protein